MGSVSREGVNGAFTVKFRERASGRTDSSGTMCPIAAAASGMAATSSKQRAAAERGRPWPAALTKRHSMSSQAGALRAA